MFCVAIISSRCTTFWSRFSARLCVNSNRWTRVFFACSSLDTLAYSAVSMLLNCSSFGAHDEPDALHVPWKSITWESTSHAKYSQRFSSAVTLWYGPHSSHSPDFRILWWMGQVGVTHERLSSLGTVYGSHYLHSPCLSILALTGHLGWTHWVPLLSTTV